MPGQAEQLNVELSLQLRPDGSLAAVYIRLQSGEVAETREIVEDRLLADYGERGELLGLELLGPVNISAVTNLVGPEQREPFSRIIHDRAAEMVEN